MEYVSPQKIYRRKRDIQHFLGVLEYTCNRKSTAYERAVEFLQELLGETEALEERWQENFHKAFTLRAEITANYRDLKDKLIERDGKSCKHCGVRNKKLQIDHVLPIMRGGNNDLDNLQLLCRTCNLEKGCRH